MRTFVTHITACMIIISTGGYRKLEVCTYLTKSVRLFSTIQQFLLTDYISADEEF